MALAADECSSATQPPNAPQASESRTSAISRAAAWRASWWRPRRAGMARGGPLGQRGGHEPISPICAWPSCATVAGQRLETHLFRNEAWFPVVITQLRKALIALAFAAFGWLVLTTAYS